MYSLKVVDYFASAHFLNGYDGKCESLHGHNWKVEAEVRGKNLDKIGMLIDFKILRKYLGAIIQELDHCLLNDIEDFKQSNPSAELISKYIFIKLSSLLPEGIVVSSISVWESERSQAAYFEE